ncbi:hypothetical protein GCM10009639_42180 [Kitasatospora putterlickiae]|uniref:Uncharacterized protein n=1 Tax=Kitasatospora putterlickiae TaxID=221725 RepID=A0ABP4IZ33_9ACTN
MSITAHLRGSVKLPGGAALISGSALERRGDGSRRALLRHGGELAVHELEGLFAGERTPAAVFPLLWPAWPHGGQSVSPDGRFAVFAGQRAVRAVARNGTTLWEYPHACWGHPDGHPHTGDAQEVCAGWEHGSCLVSDDGRLVWAHVASVPAARDHRDHQEHWVVLDARDGGESARLPLPDSESSGSHQLSHPDGAHIGLAIGMGQDGALLHWARLDGAELSGWDLNHDLDRVLADIHPGHPGFLTVEHGGGDLRLHALDGTVLAQREPGQGEDEDPPCWDHDCGFVDAGTVLASTLDCADDPADGRHWLLDARTLETRGSVDYPGGPADGYARPLGDGTWLTYDDADGTLNRWGVTPM